MPSWRTILLWIVGGLYEALGGLSYRQGVADGVIQERNRQKEAADAAQRKMDDVPESDAAGRLRDGTF